MVTLKDLRLQAKLTQRELAKRIGVSPSTVVMWETGQRTPRLKTAVKIARFFGVRLDDIAFGEEVNGDDT